MFTNFNETEEIAPEYLDQNFRSLVFASDNLPPQLIEAEEDILGGILLNSDAIGRAIAAGLQEKSFYLPSNAKIFRIAKRLHDEGKVTDLMNVTSRLYDCDLLDKIGGQRKLAELIDRPTNAVNIEQHVALINEKAWKREAIELANKLSQVAHDKALSTETARSWAALKLDELAKSPLLPTGDDPTKSVDYSTYNRIISELRKIEFDIEQSGFRYYLLQKLAKRYKMNLSNLTELYAASQTDHITGKSYTISELIQKYGQQERQWLMTGLLPKQGVTLLHAMGGVGKTRLAYNLACNLVLGADWGDFGVTGFDHRILIYQTDETMGNTITTLREMGFDVNGQNIRVVDHWNFDAIPQLIREVDTWKPTMVIIDSITSNNWQSPHEESKAAYAKPLLVLKDVAQGIRSQTNPAHPDQGLAWGHKTQFLVVHHSNVEGRSRGTTAIVNSATQVISIKRVREQSDLGVLVFEKSRDKISERVLIKSDPDTKRWEVLNAEYDGRYIPLEGEFTGGNLEARRPETLREAIVKFLRQRPNIKYTIAEIKEELGGDIDYIRATCGKLAALGRIEKRPGMPGHANTYYFKADIGFSIEKVTTLSKKDHPDHTPHDHPPDSDTVGDSSEGVWGDHQKSENFKNKKNNFSKKDHLPPQDSTPSPETLTQIETEKTEGGDLGGDHPDHGSASPLIDESTDSLDELELLQQLQEAIASGGVTDTKKIIEGLSPASKKALVAKLSKNEQKTYEYLLELDKKGFYPLMTESDVVATLLMNDEERFYDALRLAPRQCLEAALQKMRSPKSDRRTKIQERLTQLTTGQGTLI